MMALPTRGMRLLKFPDSDMVRSGGGGLLLCSSLRHADRNGSLIKREGEHRRSWGVPKAGATDGLATRPTSDLACLHPIWERNPAPAQITSLVRTTGGHRQPLSDHMPACARKSESFGRRVEADASWQCDSLRAFDQRV
jgi:hypothetical protein